MENQSSIPTPLAITQTTIIGYNLYAEMQHTDRKLDLILFDFMYRLFRNLFDGSLYADMQHSSGVSVRIQLRDVLSLFIKCGLFRNRCWIFKLKRSMSQEVLLRFLKNIPRIIFFSQPLISILRNSWQLNFEKQDSDLISEGTTSLWAECNDGCARGCGIHSLLFVIYYLIISYFCWEVVVPWYAQLLYI